MVLVLLTIWASTWAAVKALKPMMRAARLTIETSFFMLLPFLLLVSKGSLGESCWGSANWWSNRSPFRNHLLSAFKVTPLVSNLFRIDVHACGYRAYRVLSPPIVARLRLHLGLLPQIPEQRLGTLEGLVLPAR